MNENEPIVMVDPNVKVTGREAILNEKKDAVKRLAFGTVFKERFKAEWNRVIGNDLFKRFLPDAFLFGWALVGSFFVAGLLGKEWSGFFFGFYFAVLTAPPTSLLFPKISRITRH